MAKTLRENVQTYASVGAVFCIPVAIFLTLSWLGYSRSGTRPNFLQPYAGTGLMWTGMVYVVLMAISAILRPPQPKQTSLQATLESLYSLFPDELHPKTPPVILRKRYEDTSQTPLSWIGGPPPSTLTNWPRHPVNGQPLNHMATLSFAQLAPFVPRFMLPTYGQLSFFASPLDQIPPNQGSFHSTGFAVIMTPEEGPPDATVTAPCFPMTPLDFAHPVFTPPTESPMEGSLRDSHQMFGEGLHIQEQLYPVQDREMLLQIGNDDDVDVRLSGVMQFMMYPDDIRAQAWHKAVVVLAFD